MPFIGRNVAIPHRSSFSQPDVVGVIVPLEKVLCVKDVIVAVVDSQVQNPYLKNERDEEELIPDSQSFSIPCPTMA